MAMSSSSTVHGSQHDTKYVTFALLMHAAFVPDEIWGMPEPARSSVQQRYPLPPQLTPADIILHPSLYRNYCIQDTAIIIRAADSSS